MQQKLFIGRNISEETKNWPSLQDIEFEEYQLVKAKKSLKKIFN